MRFVANFIRFPAVQNFWKSVNIWQRYRQSKGGNFFETQCIIVNQKAPQGRGLRSSSPACTASLVVGSSKPPWPWPWPWIGSRSHQRRIVIGCAILEIAKLVMYEFYYDCLLPKFGDRHRQFHMSHYEWRPARRTMPRSENALALTCAQPQWASAKPCVVEQTAHRYSWLNKFVYFKFA